MSSLSILLGACLWAVLGSGCSRSQGPFVYGDDDAMVLLRETPDGELKTLAGKRIFFGHQSVGGNLIQGIEEVLAESGRTSLPIHEGDVGTEVGLYHKRLGSNGDPEGKVKAFRDLLQSSTRTPVDFAMMKLCYADFRANTDSKRVFQVYSEAVESVRKSGGPELLHLTVPLTVPQAGKKAMLLRWAGIPGPGDEANRRREEYNEFLRKQVPADRLFDLARLESTYPDGRPFRVRLGSHRFPALLPEYSYDGGHLNERARKLLGARFVAFLVAAAGGPRRMAS